MYGVPSSQAVTNRRGIALILLAVKMAVLCVEYFENYFVDNMYIILLILIIRWTISFASSCLEEKSHSRLGNAYQTS